MDTLCKEHRSWVMSRIRSTDTKPEKYVRTLLWSNGFRYRLHVKKLPGSPDIVLTRYKTVVDVRGCFWHRHEHCKLSRMPKSNVEFWEAKLRRNVARDQQSEAELKANGWKVIVLWECELKHTHELVLEPLLKMRKEQQRDDKES
jgi:DNA mismatch endonuclease (patch repair protein)